MIFPLPSTVFGSFSPIFYHDSLNWTQPGMFADLGGTRPADGRYLVFVGVGDFVRLSPDHSTFTLFDGIPPEVLADIRDGRALLALDHSNEGPNFMKPIFDGFHRAMAEAALPLSSTLLITQNRLMATAYEAVYGRTGLSFGLHDFFVKLLIASLDEDASRLVGTADEVLAHRPELEPDAKDFLCMNATPRWNRVLLYRYLTMQGHAERGLLSFHGANLFNPKVSSLDQVYYSPAVPRDFGDLIADIEAWMPREPIRFDTDKRMGNDLAQSLETWAYRGSLYSIVTESDFFDEDQLERVTEKIIKAAGLGHPFIVVGNPRSVRFMAELGFDTFAGVIDHDYDLVRDPTERLRMIFREIDRQQKAIAADRAGWIAATRPGAYHNVIHARQGGLRHRYARLVEQPLLQRLERFIATGSLDLPA